MYWAFLNNIDLSNNVQYFQGNPPLPHECQHFQSKHETAWILLSLQRARSKSISDISAIVRGPWNVSKAKLHVATGYLRYKQLPADPFYAEPKSRSTSKWVKHFVFLFEDVSVIWVCLCVSRLVCTLAMLVL